MLIDIDIINLIKDELLTYPSYNAEDVYFLARLAQEDPIVYSLMNKWMEQIDDTEREYLYHDMLHRKDQLVAKVIPFRKLS